MQKRKVQRQRKTKIPLKLAISKFSIPKRKLNFKEKVILEQFVKRS